MEIKGRYRVMWWIGIVLTVLFSGLLGITRIDYSGMVTFNLVYLPVCLVWFIFACTARHRKMWGYFGIVLSSYIMVSGLSLYCASIRNEGIFYHMVQGVIAIFLILVIAFMILRRQELMALLSYGSSKKACAERTEKEQQALNAVYSMEMGKTQKPKAVPVTVQKPIQKSPVYKKVDVNHCQMEDLLELPGISLEMAQKAIKDREENGMYQSPDDFLRRNPAKPHFIERIVARIEVKAENEETMATIPKEDSRAANEKKRGLDL